MTARWRQYIEKGIHDAGGPIPFALEQWAALFPLVLTVARSAPRGGRLLDVGCGAGIFAACLAHRGYSVTGIDQDASIVELAIEMVEYLRSSARIAQGSAHDLGEYHGGFDLVYSLGVVEHFDRETTIELIREQARCAPRVLVAVPTRYTKFAGPITDERLYTRPQLEQIVRNAGLTIRESYVYGEVPTKLAKNLERFLPRAAYTRLKNSFSYGMGLVVLGEK